MTPRTSRRRPLTKEAKARGSPTVHPCGGVQPGEVKQWTEALDSLTRVNGELTHKVRLWCVQCAVQSNSCVCQEEEILKLNQRTRSLNERQKSNKVVVPELEEIVR